MEIRKKKFKKMFPHLCEELACKSKNISLSFAKSQNDNRTKELGNYEPTVIDFIRRCDTEIQAKEVISFLEKKGDISRECSDKLRKELSEKGVGAFGKKKRDGYYLGK